MALGAQNKQQMAPAQFVGQVSEGRLVGPGQYSGTNYQQGFDVGDEMRGTQQAIEAQARFNDAQQAADEAAPWRMVNNVLSTLDKAQPNIERLKMQQAAELNASLNREINNLNENYARAMKGDGNAQSKVFNWTFPREILEKTDYKTFMDLNESLSRAKTSLLLRTQNSNQETIKSSLGQMSRDLTGQGNPDAFNISLFIRDMLMRDQVTSDNMNELSKRLDLYKGKYPNNKINFGVFDTYRQDIEAGERDSFEFMSNRTPISSRDINEFIKTLNTAKEKTLDPALQTAYEAQIAALTALMTQKLNQELSRGSGATSGPGRKSSTTSNNPILNQFKKSEQ